MQSIRRILSGRRVRNSQKDIWGRRPKANASVLRSHEQSALEPQLPVVSAMTDVLEKLRTAEAFIVQPPPPSTTVPRWPIDHILREAADEIERLRSAYLAHIQMENACKRTGKPCREEAKCGCFLECTSLVMEASSLSSSESP